MTKIKGKRVFVGIPIGTAIKPILPILKFKFAQSSEYLKWIPISNIHLTLKFIGTISIDIIPTLVQSIEKGVSQFKFNLEIDSTGVFPSTHSPKIFWLGIKKGIDELKSLHTQIEQSLENITPIIPKNSFTPHITIAKITKKFVKIDVLPFLNTVYSPIELSVNSICLYESYLFPEGAKYQIIKKFPLNR